MVSMGGWSTFDSSIGGIERNAFGEGSTIPRENDVRSLTRSPTSGNRHYRLQFGTMADECLKHSSYAV